MVAKTSLALPLFFCSLLSIGQSSSKTHEDTSANHIVIGAFASRENAVRFADEARQQNPGVEFDINPARQLFYVYVLKTDNRVRAFAEARRLREESKYWDTWVYYGTLGENEFASGQNSSEDDGGTNGLARDRSISSSMAKNEALAAEIKSYSMGDEPTGLDVNKMISAAQTQQERAHYKAFNDVKESVSQLDKTTKIIVFKDDAEGRKALRSLGYEIEEGKPVGGFFDSKNNILAINASETNADEPFHEGLRPVVKFLRKKNPEVFQSLAKQAANIKHPSRGVAYNEINATDEEALANIMADLSKGYFENSAPLKTQATSLVKEMLETLGVDSEVAISENHLKVTANNLALAVREATGFDSEGNRKFRFNLFNTMNLKKINGEVDLVNESGRKLASYKGNEIVQVMRADASGNIILACEVLGYRKLLFKLNYDNPFLTERVERGEDEEAIVPFGLVRLQKGDIAVMYNVYFFKDAAIMRPESRYEINNLLAMMDENKAYKILIHGHTNGNASGQIITMGGSKNYFSLNDTKEGRGSAKKLSEERAEVIREYLVDQGVATDRMTIKAWGGKRPLYDKNHSLAQSNVRVEIEILEN